jgi:hypothetical protein
MASGGIEQDFPADDDGSITPGETLSFRWAIEDSAGAAIASFSGWTEVKMYWLAARGAANGLTALESGSLLELTATLSVPNATCAMTAANWATVNSTMKARTYYYELWRTDSGSEQRLAYGKIETLD